MTQPALAHATEFGRMYGRSLNDTPSVPSITTVIGMQAMDLSGWAGYMAASKLAAHPGLVEAAGRSEKLRPLVREAANAAENYRNEAAARGDRVHFYAEQVALRALDREHEVERAQAELAEHQEQRFAQAFDAWWQEYRVQPLAPEVTIWNQSVGYAGTLDLVAEISGRLCLIDYKTKGTDRNGELKAVDPKVVMQLVAGMKAEESLLDARAGQWEAWKYGQEPLLLAVAIGETGVRPMRANPSVLPQQWYKFCALHRLWERNTAAAQAGEPLLPLAPPRPTP
ncbi:PD-(D/E)XK nuclease family protein [Psychromicrobium lacuslunae]|uniref:Cytochrome P450 n=1 Tax=Psychromicrobium lacuslunae TaxID=1618207 RepID=A0A0D4BXF6_9MICC|nr:PD-(D/E)XK nuclease family protein [Psychromicrobium lacuslunae]AJT40806.1 cytochrome P450 [Psychromicrobium lacuslunae]